MISFKYISQPFRLLQENKFLSIISILGTALSIAMIMVVVILFRAKTADTVPEVNRSRSLYVKLATARTESGGGYKYRLSLQDVKEVFYPLTTPEAVTAIYGGAKSHTSIPGGAESVDSHLLYTDAAFWKMFQFRFLAGAPFDAAMVESGMKNVVINETTARTLYGRAEEAVGKRIFLNYVEHAVIGVVKDVHKFAEHSYSDIWLPYTSDPRYSTPSTGNEGRVGGVQCYILAYSPDDFPKIEREILANLARYNSSAEKTELIIEGPETFFEQMDHEYHGERKTEVAPYLIMIFVLLLVPSINLSSMANSRMKKRLPEIGLRKAFGATRREIMMKVLGENLVITVIGGITGLILSYLAIWLFSDWLLSSRLGGTASMSLAMFSPWVFLIAFLFCLLINLLSAGIPAWRASGTEITVALNDR